MIVQKLVKKSGIAEGKYKPEKGVKIKHATQFIHFLSQDTIKCLTDSCK